MSRPTEPATAAAARRPGRSTPAARSARSAPAVCTTNSSNNNNLADYPAGTTSGDLLLFIVANGATQNADFAANGNSNGWNPVSATWPTGINQELQAFYGFAHSGASDPAATWATNATITAAAIFTASGPDYTGDAVSGPGIPAGDYIVSVNTSTHVATLAAKTTSAGTGLTVTSKVNARLQTNSNGACGWVVDYKVATTEPPNGTTVFGSQATGTSLTPATFSTANSKPSIVISIAEVATAGAATAPTLGAANGFASRLSATQQPSSGIGFSIADRNVAATGAVGSPTWTEPASSQWVYLTFAFS